MNYKEGGNWHVESRVGNMMPVFVLVAAGPGDNR